MRVGRRLESRRRNSQRVVSDGEPGQVITAGVIGLGGPDGAAIHIGCGYFGGDDGRTAGVGNRTDNRCGHFLRQNNLGHAAEGNQYQREKNS